MENSNEKSARKKIWRLYKYFCTSTIRLWIKKNKEEKMKIKKGERRVKCK